MIKGRAKIFSCGAAFCLAIGGLGACAGKSRGAFPVPDPSPAVATASAGLRVSLFWTAPVDLDLYVTDPSLESVYFANAGSQTGGRLERDFTCGTPGGEGGRRSEETRWAKPPNGRYRVGVDFMDACGGDVDEVSFVVVAEVSGRRKEQRGKLLKGRFNPVVLEFDVPLESRETPAPNPNQMGS